MTDLNFEEREELARLYGQPVEVEKDPVEPEYDETGFIKVRLPIGVCLEGSDERHTVCYVDRLKAADEKIIANLAGDDQEDAKRKNINLGEFTTKLCARILQGFFPQKLKTNKNLPFSSSVVRKMYQPDRDEIIFQSRLASYGPEFTFVTNCYHCGKPLEIVADLNDIRSVNAESFYYPEDEDTIAIPFTLIDGVDYNGSLVKAGTFRVFTGEEQEALVKFSRGKSPGDSLSLFLAKVISSFDGVPSSEITVNFVDELTMRDRQWLYRQQLDNNPGPKLFVKEDCWNCRGSVWGFFNLLAFVQSPEGVGG